MTGDNRYRCLYKGHLLSYEPTRLDNGRLQARIAITSLSADVTIAQRFIDLETCDSEAEAVSHARQHGMDWVDRHTGG